MKKKITITIEVEGDDVKVAGNTVKSTAVKPNPVMVTFTYPDKDTSYLYTPRKIQLIAANTTYIVGLDVNDKNRFKKYRRDRMKELNIDFNANSIK